MGQAAEGELVLQVMKTTRAKAWTWECVGHVKGLDQQRMWEMMQEGQVGLRPQKVRIIHPANKSGILFCGQRKAKTFLNR